MGTIKDRKHMDLTEAEDIKKWREYTEKLCKKKYKLIQISINIIIKIMVIIIIMIQTTMMV